GVLDDDARAGLAFWNFAPRPAVNFHRAKKFFRDFVAPIAKRAFSEFHDVTLVHERHGFAFEFNRVGNRAVYQAHATGIADRLDADADLHIAREIRRADGFPEFFGGGFGP